MEFGYFFSFLPLNSVDIFHVISRCNIFYLKKFWACPHGVMVKAVDCGIDVREFVLQSRYYVRFRANTLAKSMNPLILPAMG